MQFWKAIRLLFTDWVTFINPSINICYDAADKNHKEIFSGYNYKQKYMFLSSQK